MLPARVWTLLMLIGTASLAGCLGNDGADPGDDLDDLDGDAGTGNSTVGNGTVDGATPGDLPALVPSLAADVVNGTAPLLVNLTLSAEGGENATWRIDFGDGNSTDGEGLPATVNHTFGPGNHTVTATVQRGNETSATNLTVTAAVPAATGPGLPETTHFEFGDSLGCAGDVIGIVEGQVHLGLNCVTFMEGPSANGVDGYWQELGPAYWGLVLTSTVDQSGGSGGVGTPVGTFLNDSDCVFTDADFNVLGEGNNGGDPCTGEIPAGTQWLFIYPYATPALSMTVDVALP